MNAATGLALKMFGPYAPTLLRLCLAGMGVLFSLAFYELALRSLCNRVGALAISILVIVNPSYILLENNYFYTAPTLALLTLALLGLERYAHTQLSAWLALYGVCCGFVVMLRSMYHPLWLLVMLILPLLIRKPHRRHVALILFLLMAVLAWPLKNLFVFGHFTTSSWSGMNLYSTVYNQSYTEQEIWRFYQGTGMERRRPSGSTFELGHVRPFSPPSTYTALIPYVPTGHTVLDEPLKNGSFPNYNHGIYLKVSEIYFQDYLNVVKANPGVLRDVLQSSFAYFFRPPGDYVVQRLTPVGRDNSRATYLVDELFRKLFYWQPLRPRLGGTLSSNWSTLSYSMVAITLIVLSGLPPLALRVPDASVRGLALMIWINTAYVVVVGNLCENFENMRFRFEIEPQCLLGLLLIVGYRRELFGRLGRPGHHRLAEPELTRTFKRLARCP